MVVADPGHRYAALHTLEFVGTAGYLCRQSTGYIQVLYPFVAADRALKSIP